VLQQKKHKRRIKQMTTIKTKQIMEMFDGEEMWSNALGERFEELDTGVVIHG
jgi:hypothetical protein